MPGRQLEPVGRVDMGEVPKLYGLGEFEQDLLFVLNEAVDFLLSGLPDRTQIDVIDQLNEGGLSFDLQ